MLGQQKSDSAIDNSGVSTFVPEPGTTRQSTVASQLAELRSSLLEHGQSLAQVVDGPAKVLVDDVLETLQKQVCRIAVIGQVKAGKSTFINALIRQPGLLPTHVNPWTTAVTNLHFQHAAADGHAAQFTFFDPDEWHRLGSGSGRLRELTEQLVPGFEVDLLVRNLKSMRARAELRHGEQLKQLLGTIHSFPNSEPSLIQRYVCAGDEGPLAAATTGIGQYSDIVKRADLYLSGSPFAFPTTVIDTPGFNDPFLIRDEISRQALDNADVYIVVVSALQPLSTADVALFRMLRGLHKERIVVFINRIDQLANVKDDLSAVKLQVRNGLRREFPGIDVPIIAGSALWANQSLAYDQAESTALVSPPAELFRRHQSIEVFRNALAQAQKGDLSTAVIRRAMYEASEMSELSQTLDTVVTRSHPAHVIGHVSASLSELSQFGEMSCKHELQRITANLNEQNHNTHTQKDELDKLLSDVRRMQDLYEQTVGAFRDLDGALQGILAQEANSLTSALRDVVQDFSDQECLRLSEAIHLGESGRNWRTEASGLRQLLEAHLGERMGEIHSKLSEAEIEVLPRIREIVSQVLHDSPSALRSRLRPLPAPAAPLGALSQPVTFDIGRPWWKAWWSAPLSAQERCDALDRAIRMQFVPIADELARSAIRLMRDQATGTLKEAESICLSVIHTLSRQSEQNVARLQDLKLAQAHVGDPGQTEALRSRLDQVRSQLSAWQGLNQQLAILKRRSHQLLA